MVPQVLSARSLNSSRVASRALGHGSNQLALRNQASFATRLGHYTSQLAHPPPPDTSASLAIIEGAPALLNLTIPAAEAGLVNAAQNEVEQTATGSESQVSLYRGFKATVPTSELAKQRRRQVRGNIADDDLLLTASSSSGGRALGLKKLGDRARGLLTEGEDQTEAELEEERSRARKLRRRRLRKGRGGAQDGELAAIQGLGLDELTRQVKEIAVDQDNLRVRKNLISGEIADVTSKIDALETIRRRLEGSLIRMQEEELELDDEMQGVKEAMSNPAITAASASQATLANDPTGATLPSTTSRSDHGPGSGSIPSRRRRGPAFLPSEHDELPRDVAFMTLSSHQGPITSLDFSEPYGVAVTAGEDETVRVWDLCDGEQMGTLVGHQGVVKCVQVEGQVALTGGEDGAVRLWELERVEDWEEQKREAEDKRSKGLEALLEEREDERAESPTDLVGKSLPEITATMDDRSNAQAGAIRDGGKESKAEGDPCLRVLNGHSKAITSLYYEDNCLVTGSNDKTVRQWDVNTGQCILTMDILWAISNPPAMTINTINPATTPSPLSSPRRPGLLGRSSTYRKGSIGSGSHYGAEYDPFEDPFISSTSPGAPGMNMGMASGSGFMNATTGQFAVPTPPFADSSWKMYQDFVGGVQFWGYALATGSGDGGVRMWDSRLPVHDDQHRYMARYSHFVDLIVRTGQAHRTLIGHMGPVTCLQFDESVIVSGSLDKTIRVSIRSPHAPTGPSVQPLTSYPHNLWCLESDLGPSNGLDPRDIEV